MQTERMTMAQALIKSLSRRYICIDGMETLSIESIAIIFGHGDVLDIDQMLEWAPGHLQVVRGCNEQGIAHMVTGFVKQYRRQRIFAMTSSAGLGAANMVVITTTATTNHIPLLLLPGDAYADHRPNPVLQQIERYHDLDISTSDYFYSVL